MLRLKQKRIIRFGALNGALLLLTGCGVTYTREDALRVRDITMSDDYKPTAAEYYRLDSNRDGEITPADYVHIMNQLEKRRNPNDSF